MIRWFFLACLRCFPWDEMTHLKGGFWQISLFFLLIVMWHKHKSWPLGRGYVSYVRVLLSRGMTYHSPGKYWQYRVIFWKHDAVGWWYKCYCIFFLVKMEVEKELLGKKFERRDAKDNIDIFLWHRSCYYVPLEAHKLKACRIMTADWIK